MKKVLLTLLTLFAVSGAWAQVTETDLATYDDVIYAKSTTALQGSTAVTIPIYSKTHDAFTGTYSEVVVPDGATITRTGSISADAYDASMVVQLVTWAGNYPDADVNLYRLISTIASTDEADNKQGFFAGDHELGTLIVDVSSLKPGEYPIVIKNTEISGFLAGDADAKVTEEITTTLTITDRVILDETSTTVPETLTGVNVTVKRTINKNEWSTLCLPFDMTAEQVKKAFGDDVELAYFDDQIQPVTVENDGTDIVAITINFTADDLSLGFFGNYPYVIKVSKDIETFDVDGVNVSPSQANAQVYYKTGNARTGIHEFGFYGTLSAGTTIPENGLFLSDNKFWYAGGSKTIKGFRGYFNFTDVLTNKDASAKINFNVDGEATSINGINSLKVVEGVYDLSGRKILIENNDLNTLQKGVYIIDGKKVTIK